MSTIVAISTAPTIGGIGIVRLSGKECFQVLKEIFVQKNPQQIEEIKGYRIKYGNIINPTTKKVIDEVLVSYFKSPKSYTAEDMCEINSHGGIVVLRQILNLCLKYGAILAEPGEFTKRAFLNGRIDLTQAEAVADIINAKSTRAAQESTKQLQGFLSKAINKIKSKAMEILIDIEASIDYPEYDIEVISIQTIKQRLEQIEKELKQLSKSFETGKILKEGIKIAIIGSPNVGKSSLLNTILKEERAIVTDIAGTTRDTIEEQAVINGIPFKIIDTAGIRNTENEIEKIGIEKSKKVADESDVIIAIFDNSRDLQEEDKEILKIIKEKKSIIVINKTDIKTDKLEKSAEIGELHKPIIKMSIKNDEGLENLFNEISNLFNLNQINLGDESIITNIRHQELINMATDNTRMALNALNEAMPTDIIAINIKQILEHLGEITGDNVSEDIIKNIFSKFCLGK